MNVGSSAKVVNKLLSNMLFCCCFVGKQTSEESLLHFALRHRLLKLVDYLLEGADSPVNKRQLISNLEQESFDYITVEFLATANYPDILPKLKKMYKDEIGSQISMGL